MHSRVSGNPESRQKMSAFGSHARVRQSSPASARTCIPAQAGIQSPGRRRPHSAVMSASGDSSFPRKRESRVPAEDVRIRQSCPRPATVPRFREDMHSRASGNLSRRVRCPRPRKPQASGGPSRHSRVSGNPEFRQKTSAFGSHVRVRQSSPASARTCIPAQAGIQSSGRRRPHSAVMSASGDSSFPRKRESRVPAEDVRIRQSCPRPATVIPA